MNKILNTLLISLIFFGTAYAQNSEFVLGTHYQRLSPTQPTSSSPDQVEVAEIFWYGCPHCYTFDPYLENWKETLAEDVNFIRIPAVWNNVLQTHAKVYFTAELLDVIDDVHTPIFREIHVNRNMLTETNALVDFFAQYGVMPDEFNQTFESFAVFTRMQRADELSRRYRISSVPTVVVNGKYVTNATMAGDYPDLLRLVDELVAMERAEQ
ncbi:MAG: thiol:disulfide interchange protein DsbA/DsbL [Gammaproteobacteria bacterium]|jgi:thiol:disulfide interchange protein DsbA